MKNLNEIALEIIQAEQIIQNDQSSDKVKQAQARIEFLASQLTLEDLLYLDEYIQEYFAKKN